jgi:hypothetical protein
MESMLSPVYPVRMDDFIQRADALDSDALTDELRTDIIDAIVKANLGKDVTMIEEADKLKLIEFYELLNPGDAAAFAELFKGLKADGTVGKNILNIKYTAYASAEPFHTVFFENLSWASLGYTAPHYEWFKKESQFGSYNFFGNINVDLTCGDEYWACRVFFHEYGHYVDAMSGWPSKWLMDRIYGDAFENIRREIARRVSGEAEIDAILESLKQGGQALSDPALNAVRNRIIELYNKPQTGLLGGGTNIVASDVYGGVTANIIHGDWYHFPPPVDASYKYYWYDIFGNATGSQGKEFFAESFSNGMTQNAEALRNAQVFFPTADGKFSGLVYTLKNEKEGR